MAVRAVASYPAGVILGGTLIGANMNSTADQPITINSPARYYNIFRVVAINPSISLTTAQGSLYLGPGKTSVVMATTTAFSPLTTSAIDTTGNIAALTIQVQYLTDNPTIYLSLTTAQGAASTCDIFVYIIPLFGA